MILRIIAALLLVGLVVHGADAQPKAGNCIASLTGCTIVGPLSVGGTLTLTAVTTNTTGSVINSTSTYNWTSGPALSRVWESFPTITGTIANATQEPSFTQFYPTVAGGTSQPNVTATVSGGAIVTPLTIATAGSGLTNGTYSLYFQGGGGTGAVGTFTVSGGSVTAAACSPCGSGYTSAPAVGLIIGTVGLEAFNIVHPQFNSDSGVYLSGYGEGFESSALNNGIIATYEAHNAQYNNGTIGITGIYIGTRCAAVNTNPVRGSFNNTTCLFIPQQTSGATTGSGGAVTATQSGGAVTLSIATAGSGYPNGTYDLTFSGGGCATYPVGSFTVSGGSITATSLSVAGAGCTGNPTVGLYFGSLPSSDYSAQIVDQYSTFATTGNIAIGTASTVGLNQDFYIQARSASAGEFPIAIKGNGGSSTLFYITAAGSVAMPAAFTIATPVCSLSTGVLGSNCSYPTTTKTTNFSVPAGNSGMHYDNIGAAGTVTFTLPAAAAGLNYCFAVAAAQAVQVAPLTSDVIYVNSSASTNGTGGGYVTDSTPYGSVCLESHAAGTWFASNYSGTWTTH